MNPFNRMLQTAIAVTLLPAVALAAAPAHDHNHGATPPAPATAAASPEMADTAPPGGDEAAPQLLERMRDAHQRLSAARNAGERQKALAESRRLLQEAMAQLNAAPGMQDMERGKGMGMMDQGNGGNTAPSDTTPGKQAPGSAMGGMGAGSGAEGGKSMGDMAMQCMDMHTSMAQHMALMHAVLQALVDQQTAAPPAK